MKESQLQNLLNHNIQNDNVLLVPITFNNEDSVEDAPDPERKPEWGLVVSVGKGRVTENGDLVNIDLTPGDVVLFMAYGATPVKVLNTDFVYVRAEDIISSITQ